MVPGRRDNPFPGRMHRRHFSPLLMMCGNLKEVLTQGGSSEPLCLKLSRGLGIQTYHVAHDAHRKSYLVDRDCLRGMQAASFSSGRPCQDMGEFPDPETKESLKI